MEKKYKLGDKYPGAEVWRSVGREEGAFRRIVALRDFGDVKKGDIGGWVATEDNLSHDGKCWVYEDAMVYGNAKISDDVKVEDEAQISDNVQISGQVKISDTVEIWGDVTIGGNGKISNDTTCDW